MAKGELWREHPATSGNILLPLCSRVRFSSCKRQNIRSNNACFFLLNILYYKYNQCRQRKEGEACRCIENSEPSAFVSIRPGSRRSSSRRHSVAAGSYITVCWLIRSRITIKTGKCSGLCPHTIKPNSRGLRKLIHWRLRMSNSIWRLLIRTFSETRTSVSPSSVQSITAGRPIQQTE